MIAPTGNIPAPRRAYRGRKRISRRMHISDPGRDLYRGRSMIAPTGAKGDDGGSKPPPYRCVSMVRCRGAFHMRPFDEAAIYFAGHLIHRKRSPFPSRGRLCGRI